MTSSKAGRHVRGEISSSSLCDLSFLFLPFYCLYFISLPFIFLYFFSLSIALCSPLSLFPFSLVSYLSRELFKTTPTRLLWSVLQKHRNKTHSHTHTYTNKVAQFAICLMHVMRAQALQNKIKLIFTQTHTHTHARAHTRTIKPTVRMHLVFRETCTSSDTISYS